MRIENLLMTVKKNVFLEIRLSAAQLLTLTKIHNEKFIV